MHVSDQVVSIFAGGQGFMDDIPVEAVLQFRDEMREYLHAHNSDLLDRIVEEGKLSDELQADLKAAISRFKQQFVIEGQVD